MIKVALTGSIGMGKSTVLRYLYGEYAAKEDCVTTLIPTPKFPTLFGMLKYICSDYEIEPKRSFVAQQDALQEFLLSQYQAGKNVVLFIDEAYYLHRPENERDYGQEAIEILLQAMENERDKLVVILAGYKDRMNDFFNSNPGMQSRVAHHIDFPDYNDAELLRAMQQEHGDALFAHALRLTGGDRQRAEALERVNRGDPRGVDELAKFMNGPRRDHPRLRPPGRRHRAGRHHLRGDLLGPGPGRGRPGRAGPA